MSEYKEALEHIQKHGLISGDHDNFEKMSEGKFDDVQQTIEEALHKAELFDNMLEEITSAQFTHTSIGNVYTDRRRVYEIVEDTQAKYEEIK